MNLQSPFGFLGIISYNVNLGLQVIDKDQPIRLDKFGAYT